MRSEVESEQTQLESRTLPRVGKNHLPLRFRLTLWYLLALAIILLLFLAFLYWQVQRTLLAQVDAALRLAANQALVGVAITSERLAFHGSEINLTNRPFSDDFAVYLLAPDGTLWDSLGNQNEFLPQPPIPGLRTLPYDDDLWRVFTERIVSSNGSEEISGWIQVAEEMDPITATLASLRNQMFVGLPLALFLAGLGGLVLATHALRPIERITSTAQAIDAGDLSRRIEYQGSADEVGRLAATFDRMLDRLEAAFEREHRFIGDAAHELRTPLTAMKGRVEVTLSRPRTVDAYTETLQEIEGQVDRLIHLSNDLLFMARLDQDMRHPRHREEVVLSDLLPAIIDQVQPLAGQKDIVFTTHILSEVAIEGDMDLLIRLFLNLLDNAIKYTPSRGDVVVTIYKTADEAVVTVGDSGPGVPAEHLPHLFERFYRVEGDRGRYLEKNGRGGAGLGLAIAAEIVRMHDGRIQVESQPGAGTTFTVCLPHC